MMNAPSLAQRSVARLATMSGLVAIAASVAVAPAAQADPVACSKESLDGTVSSVTSGAGQYLSNHPGANQVLMAAYGQSPSQASASVRSYFTANPTEYFELKSILAPIGEAQRQCNVSVLPASLATAYNEFMAG